MRATCAWNGSRSTGTACNWLEEKMQASHGIIGGYFVTLALIIVSSRCRFARSILPSRCVEVHLANDVNWHLLQLPLEYLEWLSLMSLDSNFSAYHTYWDWYVWQTSAPIRVENHSLWLAVATYNDKHDIFLNCDTRNELYGCTVGTHWDWSTLMVPFLIEISNRLLRHGAGGRILEQYLAQLARCHHERQIFRGLRVGRTRLQTNLFWRADRVFRTLVTIWTPLFTLFHKIIHRDCCNRLAEN